MSDSHDSPSAASDLHADTPAAHDGDESYYSETGTAAGRPAAPSRRPRRAARAPRYDEPPAKSPLLAAFLGMVPGLGNIYNGLYARGLVFFLLVVSLFYSAIDSGEGPHLALLIPSLIFVWLFSIFDGYRQATLINWGWEEEDPSLASQRSSGSLAAGIALFVIGFYGLLHHYFDIDLSALLEHWYLLIMAVGGWLIFQTWRDRTDRDRADSSI